MKKKNNIKITSLIKNISINKIHNDLLLLNKWEDKYNYIIDISEYLLKMPILMKNNNNSIYDCQSKVWCNAEYKKNKIFLYGDSESIIIKGLITIIYIFFNNKKIKEINDIEFKLFLSKIKFLENFTINKYQGLISIKIFLKNKIYNLIKKNNIF